jgi:hypothetical protein
MLLFFILHDHSSAFVVGHSLNDLDSKDAALAEAPEPNRIINLFEDRWNAATGLSLAPSTKPLP